MSLGLLPDGTLEVPPGPTPAGWFDGGPTPGARGAAVIAGHVTFDGARGVFFRLSEIKRGASIQVLRRDGKTATFSVTSIESFAKNSLPTVRVYGGTPGSELRLVTCTGDYDPASHSYPDNLVVFAKLTSVKS